MTDKIDKYVVAIDNARDFATYQADQLKQTALEDIDDLIRELGNRDPDLWDELGADTDGTLAEYEDDTDRDLDWHLGLSGISAAATIQFMLDNVEPLIIEPVAYLEQINDAFNLTQAELVVAGKRGLVGTAELQTVFAPIQARYLKELAFLKELDTLDLYGALLDAGATVPYEKMVSDAMGYVSRMTTYPPGSPQFKGAVADLVNHDSTRVLKAQNRRAVERVFTAREVDGDPAQLMVWLGEGGKNTCGYCLDRFGIVQPYHQWVVDGLPGADVCAGGNLCQCVLAAV